MIDSSAVNVRPSRLGSLAPGRPLLAHVAAACIVAAAVALRLSLGLHTNLDPDEATEAVTALRILHGHLVLMESSGRYLGALDSYLMAPFIALLGPTVLGVRVAQAALGAPTSAWSTRSVGDRCRASGRLWWRPPWPPYFLSTPSRSACARARMAWCCSWKRCCCF